MSPLMASQQNLVSRFLIAQGNTLAGKIANSSPFGHGGGAAAPPDPGALVPEPAPIRSARPVSYAHPASSGSSLPILPIAIGVVALGIVAVVVMKKKKKR